MLQFGLGRFDRPGIEQIAELGFANQLAQLRLIDGKRLRAPLGERRVAVVDVVGDVVEEQRRAERRRRPRINRGDAQRAAANATEHIDERWKIEDIAQALAIGFQDDRKGTVARRHREKIGGAFPLLPERSSRAWPSPWQQQRACRGFAKARGKERGRAKLLKNQRLDLVRIGEHQSRIRRRICFREAHHEPVIAPHRLGLDAQLAANARAHRHRPGRMDAAPERRQDEDPPVAEIVARAFDEQRAIVGHRFGRPVLISEVLQEIGRRQRIESVITLESRLRLFGLLMSQLAHQFADRESELDRAAAGLAFPERHLAWLSRCRCHQHAVVRDLLDPPCRRAEQEGLAGTRFEYHFLIELADARAVAIGSSEKDSIQTTIRNRSGIGDGHVLGTLTRAQKPVDAVPSDARPQLGELVRGVASR